VSRAALEAPEGATPPEPLATWKWFNGLTHSQPQRMPLGPTLIEAGRLSRFDNLADLGRALAERLAGRPAVLRRSVASYPDFDTFPAFSIYAQAQDAEVTAAQLYVGCVAVQKATAEQLLTAIQAASGREGAN
jgi:hypothetical protein